MAFNEQKITSSTSTVCIEYRLVTELEGSLAHRYLHTHTGFLAIQHFAGLINTHGSWPAFYYYSNSSSVQVIVLRK